MLSSGGAQVRSDDNEVDILQLLDRLELDDNKVGDKHVPSMTSVLLTVVEYSDLNLTFEIYASLGKLDRVYRLQEAWTQRAVNLNGCPDDLVCKVCMHQHAANPGFLGSS